MKPDATGATRSDQRCSLRIETACDFSAVRAATVKVRDWLGERGMGEADLGAWELALVEGANNAVKYASPEARQRPIVIEVSCGNDDVEVQITDHTAGFEWPTEIKSPSDEAESGRGLFLMQSLTDNVHYLRSPGRNVLVMRRARPKDLSSALPDTTRLQARLAEAETSLTDMTAELASSYESLVALFRYSAELGKQTDIKDFSHRLLQDLVQIVEADSAVLRLLSPDGKRLDASLALPETGKKPPATIALASQETWAEIKAAAWRQDVWFDAREPLAKDDPLRTTMPVGNGICHPFQVGEHLVGTIALGRLAADRPFTAAQINLLHSFIDFLAIQVVNTRLLDERTAARVTQHELQIAADIQRSLLPAEIPSCPPYALACACQNAQKVGGDFYDLIPAGDGAVVLVIADVMGKGVPAALFAAVLRSTIRSMPQLFSTPGDLLMAANRTLLSDLERVGMFITAQVTYLNGREMISASAGHCPLLVWEPGDAEASLPGTSGMPLVIDSEAVYAQIVIPMPPGAVALMYTDGLSETRNAAGEMMGEKRLRALLAEAATRHDGIEPAKQFLLQRIQAHTGHTALTDDQTLILIKHHA